MEITLYVLISLGLVIFIFLWPLIELLIIAIVYYYMKWTGSIKRQNEAKRKAGWIWNEQHQLYWPPAPPIKDKKW